MSPEIVVNLQDSNLYCPHWWCPSGIAPGTSKKILGFKPIGVQVKALPLSFTGGLPTGQLSLPLSSSFKKKLYCQLKTASRVCKLPLDLKWLFNFCCLAHPNGRKPSWKCLPSCFWNCDRNSGWQMFLKDHCILIYTHWWKQMQSADS
jgi:hypothetical protein